MTVHFTFRNLFSYKIDFLDTWNYLRKIRSPALPAAHSVQMMLVGGKADLVFLFSVPCEDDGASADVPQ